MRPNDRKYQKSHEWVKLEGDVATIGITDYAVKHLSDLVFLDLPDPDTDLMAGEPFGEIESVKAVSDLYSPLTGRVIEQNEALLGQLDLLNKDPWEGGWMLKIKVEKPQEMDALLDAEAYEALIASEKS